MVRGLNPMGFVACPLIGLGWAWKVLRARGDAAGARAVLTRAIVLVVAMVVLCSLYVFKAAPDLLLDILGVIIAVMAVAVPIRRPRN